MRGVNPLIAERSCGLAQPVPGVSQIVRKIPSESCLRRGPAVVVFSFLDPLLAVVALSTRHTQILTQSGEIAFSGIPVFQPYGELVMASGVISVQLATIRAEDRIRAQAFILYRTFVELLILRLPNL